MAAPQAPMATPLSFHKEAVTETSLPLATVRLAQPSEWGGYFYKTCLCRGRRGWLPSGTWLRQHWTHLALGTIT